MKIFFIILAYIVYYICIDFFDLFFYGEYEEIKKTKKTKKILVIIIISSIVFAIASYVDDHYKFPVSFTLILVILEGIVITILGFKSAKDKEEKIGLIKYLLIVYLYLAVSLYICTW